MSFVSSSDKQNNVMLVSGISLPILPSPPSLSSVTSFLSSSCNFSSSAVENREDGRQFCQLRYPIITLDVIRKAESSCRYSQGNSEVIAAINCVGGAGGGGGGANLGAGLGPRTQRPLPDRADIEVYVHPRVGNGGMLERSLESVTYRCLSLCVDLKKYPRTIIHVIIQIINIDGGIECVCMNAAIMALLSAGLSFCFFPLSLCIGINVENKKQNEFSKKKQENGGDFLEKIKKIESKRRNVFSILLDPTANEITNLCDSLLLLTLDTKSGATVSCMDLKGCVFMTEKEWTEVMRVSTAAVFTLEHTIRNVWINHMNKFNILFLENNYKNEDDDTSE